MLQNICSVVFGICFFLLIPTSVIAWVAATDKDKKSPRWNRFSIEFLWVVVGVLEVSSSVISTQDRPYHRLIDLVMGLFVLGWRTYEAYRRSNPVIPSSEKLHKEWLSAEQEKVRRESTKIVKACLADLQKHPYRGEATVIYWPSINQEVLAVAQERFSKQGWVLIYDESRHALCLNKKTTAESAYDRFWPGNRIESEKGLSK